MSEGPQGSLSNTGFSVFSNIIKMCTLNKGVSYSTDSETETVGFEILKYNITKNYCQVLYARIEDLNHG